MVIPDNIIWLLACCMVYLHSSQAQGTDLTIVPETKGAAVVRASIDKITAAGIFDGSDEQMLRRIAYTETNDGEDKGTYSDDYHGGIWRLSEEKYQATKQSSMTILDAIKSNSDLAIDWTNTTWRDLRKPLWSALAAQLYLNLLAETTMIPFSFNHNEQANFWLTNYTTSSKTVEDYLSAIANLTLIEACRISGMDLFFVLDESGSVGFGNYQVMKTFVNQWIDSLNIGEDDVRVGLMAFNSGNRIHFNFNRYYDKSDMMNAVSAIPYGSGGTNTAGALTSTRLNAFTTANGARPSSSGIPKVVVVITDGRSNSFSETEAAASQLHDENFIVFAIGIAGANMNELHVIASRPSYVAFLNEFDPIRLRALQVDASSTVCKASPNTPLDEEITDTIEEGETKYLNYRLPSNTTGITLQVDVQSGKIILYASSTTENPNEANHDVKFEVEKLDDIFIDVIGAKPGDVTTEPIKILITEIRPNISRSLGSTVTIWCQAYGKPAPSIAWLKDGIQLLPSQKISINSRSENNITRSVITVAYLGIQDTGSYECFASHTLPDGAMRNASSSVLLNITSSSISIDPPRGNMLGGTPIIIRGLFFNDINALVECSFNDTKYRGVIVSTTEALCVSPRFDAPGSKTFLFYLNGKVVETRATSFYAIHFSELADVILRHDSLIVDSSQTINLRLTPSLLLSLSNDASKRRISVKGYIAKVLAGRPVPIGLPSNQFNFQMNSFELKADIIVKLPMLEQSIQSSPPQNNVPPSSLVAPFSLVLLKVSIDSSSGDNEYYEALKKLNMMEIGIWSHVLFYKSNPNSFTDLCNDWNRMPQYHPVNFQDITACPCTLAQAEEVSFLEKSSAGKKIVDRYLHGDTTCFDERQGMRDGFQECCYDDRDPRYLIDGPMAGTIHSYSYNTWEQRFVYDIAPFISCLRGSTPGNDMIINIYHPKRNSDRCSTFKEQNPGTLSGDPHMRTLDGFEYTFNGRGEFILLETVNGSFSLQGRMESITTQDGSQSAGTVFSAIAAKETHSDSVEFRKGYPSPTIHVNGIQRDITVELSEQYKEVIVSVKPDGTPRAVFSSGVLIEAKQRNEFLSNIFITVPDSFKDNTQGLMGVYNDDPTDDLRPYGSPMSLPSNASMTTIHNSFGLTWIISDESNSLFTYDQDNNFQSFYDPSFTPVFEPVFTDPLLAQEANEICKGNRYCLFDIAATGNKEIGKETLEQQLEIEEIVRKALSPVLCDPPCVKGTCIANNTCNCRYGYAGPLCDTEDACTYNPTLVDCEEAVAGWVFNTNSGTCTFGGCPGRGKIFSTLAECVKSCGGCPTANVSTTECLVDPCHFSTCEAFPHSSCEVDSCNPCIPRFTLGAKEVTDMCKLQCNINHGNTKFKPTDCVTNPCDGKFCPNFPQAVCLPDYCEGNCNAKFFNRFGVDVTDRCTNCSIDKPALLCPHNLCDHQHCHNYPDATCLLETCGECKAKFYEDAVEVTEQCEHCTVEGQIFTDCGSSCPKTCSNFNDNRQCQQSCKPGCQCPMNMVLDEENNKCVLMEDCPCHCDPVPANCSSVFIPEGNETCQCPICKDCSIEGQVFQECLSCPNTCSESRDAELSCSAAGSCQPGCQCPLGMLYDELASTCVERTSCTEPDRCTLPAFTGPCKGNIRRYYYNKDNQRCEAFKYGGCMGNKNNFFTLHDCETACSSLPPSCSPSFCVKERDSMCTVRYDVTPGSTGCPFRYTVSNCRVCYYSTTPLSEPQGLSCIGGYCVSSNGGYDDQCLKNWGVCVKNSLISIIRSVPLGERIPENYKCIEYTCPSPST